MVQMLEKNGVHNGLCLLLLLDLDSDQNLLDVKDDHRRTARNKKTTVSGAMMENIKKIGSKIVARIVRVPEDVD